MTARQINNLEADRAAYEIFMMMGQEKRLFTDQLVALAKDIAKAGEQMPIFYKYALHVLDQWYGWEQDPHVGESKEVMELSFEYASKYAEATGINLQ